MARISEDQINDIRNRADIAEVIGQYIPLQKKGKGMAAVCPFHDDHDPSLSISLDKQIYKCFVCGAGGNVFTFVQNFEHISFSEAIVKVGDLVGIHLDISQYKKEVQYDPQTLRLFNTLKETNAFLMYQLNASEGKEVKEYLHHRGLSDETISKFEIGYNPGNDVLKTFLSKKGVDDQDMVMANVARVTTFDIKDVFSNRITFLIHDVNGNPVGYTARTTLKDDSIAKYINTNETPIYIKGNIVYNYHRAKPYIRKEANVYVTEGVMDAIAYDRVGIKNCIATLGTAMTLNQLKELKKLTLNLIFAYDGDKAGKNATYKIGKMAIEHGFNVRVVQNFTQKDPDEIIMEYGKDKLIEISKNHVTWVEFLLEYLKGKYDLQNYSDRKEFAKEVCGEIQKVPDQFDREHFLQLLSTVTKFDLNQLAGLVVSNEKKSFYNDVKIHNVINQSFDRKQNVERKIIRQLLMNKQASFVFKEELDFLANSVYRNIALRILDSYRTKEEISAADFINTLENDTQRAIVIDLTNLEHEIKSYSEKELKGAIRKFKLFQIDDKIKELETELGDYLDTEKVVQVLNKKISLIHQKELLKVDDGEIQTEEV